MNRSYNKLWKLMIDKKMNKTQLREAARITSNAMAKLGKDESVPVETLEKICRVLDCTIDDIMDINKDNKEYVLRWQNYPMIRQVLNCLNQGEYIRLESKKRF